MISVICHPWLLLLIVIGYATAQDGVAVPDPAYEAFSCPPSNACSQDSDCVDPNHVTGAPLECGELLCDSATGSCRLNAYNDICTETFVECANTHSLCYKGPAALDYLGSCSGWDNNECQYAWCPGINATTTATTTTTTTTSTSAPDNRVLENMAINTGSLPLVVGGNKRLIAMGTYQGQGSPEDVSTSASWTSSNPSVADSTFPGLVTAKSPGTTSLTAILNGVSASVSLTVTEDISLTPTCDVRTVKMRVLIVKQSVALDTSRGVEVAVPAIRRALGYIGVPYDEVRQTDLVNLKWKDGPCQGRYQAVIVSDGGLRWGAGAYLDADGYHLDQYQADFAVRLVNWYTWPSDAFGWKSSPVAYGTGENTNATLTMAGQEVFDYIQPNHLLSLENTWNQIAQPMEESTPLLVDNSGNAFVNLYSQGGRDMLTMTFSSNEWSRHIIILSYGVVNWATQGQFIGFRRVYTRFDIDDYFIDDDIFSVDTPCETPTDSTGVKFRMSATDLQVVADWQIGLAPDPITAEVEIDMVFNGIGSTGIYSPDTLTPLTRQVEHLFRWVSHGWNHLNEDQTTYAVAHEEVYQNQLIAGPSEMNLARFKHESMVTGQVSGLHNPNFLQAASDLGVRFLVSDTSRPGENPGDNLGLYNQYQSNILMIPRRPNNLFYNVGLRDEWVHEYNCLFQSYWGTARSLEEIIDFEAENLLVYMLRGEKYPWMFHQPNLRVYTDEQGTQKFLLEELFDAMLAKFRAIYSLPITNPAMGDLGRDIISHMEIGTANVRAELAPGFGVMMQADAATSTPLTGIKGDTNQLYGVQHQGYATLQAGLSRFLPLF